MTPPEYSHGFILTPRQLATPPTRARELATVEGLTASIAHEITQPLTSLRMNLATCLRAQKMLPADVLAALEAAEKAERDGHRLNAIMRTMRQRRVRLEAVDLPRTVEEACLLLEHDIISSAATLSLGVADNVPCAWACKIAVVQILVNLIINALQAMAVVEDRLRELHISVQHAESGHVVLSVKDSGNGIAADAQSALFEPCFTTKKDGMGIGLSICRSLMDSMGGTISGNNHETGGAVFECRFSAATG